jgi:anti-anti-sigma factor
MGELGRFEMAGASGPPDGPSFDVDWEVRRDAVVVRIRGELDMATADRFEEALHIAAGANMPTIVIDLAGCTFADLAGLRPLYRLRSQRAGPGNTLTLSNVPRHARPVLDALEL